MKYSLFVIVFLSFYAFGEPVNNFKLSPCNAEIDLPEESSQNNNSKKGLENPDVVSDRSFHQAVFHDNNGAGFLYQITCTRFTGVVKREMMKKEMNDYFEILKKRQSDASINIQKFFWIENIVGYQKAYITQKENGVGVQVIEGVFSVADSNYNISVRVITNENFYEFQEKAYLNLISSLRFIDKDVSIATVGSKHLISN